MAKQPTPLIEVVIRDEVTAGLERAKRRTQQESASWFAGIEQSFGRIGDGTQLVRREFSSLVGITGIGAFLGGGMVAGIAKITESLSGLARESLQGKYAAQALGMSVETMNRLTVRGMTLGQSQQEAQASIKGLTEGLLNMQTFGRESSEWKELLKGKGGERLGVAMEAALKRGGPEEAARVLAQAMGPMALSGQKSLRDTFHLGLGFQDMFKVDQRELAEIYELSEPEARKFALSMANLNREFENVKKTIAVALMPMFERMATGLANFLQGPGGKLVKDFGTWFKGLDIDWNGIANGVIKILNAIVSFFSSMSSILKDMDPIVQQMGGWKVIIGGLAVVLGTAGLAGWLGPGIGVAGSLAAIGTVAWVVPALISTAKGAEGSEATGGYGANEGKDIGKRLDKPGATPPDARGDTAQPPGAGAPYGRDRRGRPYPAPQNQQRSSIDDDNPENAAPYRVAGGWQPPPSSSPRVRTNTGELTSAVREFKTEVAALGNMIQNMPPTDATGAGNIAGFTGVLRRLGAGMGGGGGGGGGGYRRGGGGGGGGGFSRRGSAPGTLAPPPAGPAPTSNTPGIQGIIDQRKVVMDQLREPGNRSLAAWAIAHEQDNRSGRGDVLEALVNRANVLIAQGANPNGIVDRLLKGGFYGPINRFRRQYGRWPQAADWALEDFDAVSAEVGAGRNRIGGRTDQGMRREVAGGNVRQVGGEWYGDHSKTRSGTPAERSIKARTAGTEGYVPPAGASSTTSTSGGPNVVIGTPTIGGSGTGTGGGGSVQQVQGRVAATRRGELDPRLAGALKYASDESGLIVRVTSGGQRMEGAPGATGSHRHDQGRAADFDLIDPRTGEIVSRSDPRRLKFIEAAARAGAGGAGYGYMSDPRKLHMGITGSRAIPGQGLGPYAGSRAEREATIRGIQQSSTFDPSQIGGPRQPSPIVWSNAAEIEKNQQERQNLFARARERNIGLKIRVRGPRGVKTTADATGSISPPVIERSMDPSGGRVGFSPA